MTKKQAVRTANQFAKFNPHIFKSLGPKWDSWAVDYKDVIEGKEVRVVLN